MLEQVGIVWNCDDFEKYRTVLVRNGTVPYNQNSQFFDPNDMIAYSTERYGTVRTYVVDLDRAISFLNS